MIWINYLKMKRNKKQEPPYVSDDFQIGPFGAFEYDEDTIQEMLKLDAIPKDSYEIKKAIKEYKKRERMKSKKKGPNGNG